MPCRLYIYVHVYNLCIGYSTKFIFMEPAALLYMYIVYIAIAIVRDSNLNVIYLQY